MKLKKINSTTKDTIKNKTLDNSDSFINTVKEYENLSKGSAEKILMLAKAEQDHRHRWENNYLKIMGTNHRVGQLLMLVLSIIIVYSSIAFVMVHSTAIALIVIIAGFGFLSMFCWTNSKSKDFAAKGKFHNKSPT